MASEMASTLEKPLGSQEDHIGFVKMTQLLRRVDVRGNV